MLRTSSKVPSSPLPGSSGSSGQAGRVFVLRLGFPLLGYLLSGLLMVAVAACSGGQHGDPQNSGQFRLLVASTGLGQVFPYRITELDDRRKPTTKIIDIVQDEDLTKNLSPTNGVLPVATFGATATLPGGGAGNQFLMMKFSHFVNVESVLSALASNQANSGLTGAIQVLEYNPINEVQQFVRGRAFVGGYTYYDDPTTPILDLKLVQAVDADADGNVRILDSRANGFPRGFSGDEELVDPHSFVFVPDADANLATFEMFPADRIFRFVVTSSVLDHRNKPLRGEVCTGTVRGPDTALPQVIGFLSGNPQINPGNGDVGVDPTTTIRVSFNKPVQPREVGEFFSSTNKTPPFRGVSLSVTFGANTSPVTYYADPLSVNDLCNYTIRPAYFFPGSAPVTVAVNRTIASLSGVLVGTQVATSFTTGKGPGLVNAPVAPEAIYVGRGGSSAGVSVLDLNGFGQGTGDFRRATDPNYRFGYKRNPNIGAAGIFPALTPPTGNVDAGSLGALTLTLDTNGNDRLIDESVISQVGDIHVGAPLDKIFNNENINANYSRANQTNPLTGAVAGAWGNSITAPPIPNPPKLVFPPPNPARAIFGEDPTVSSLVGPPCPLASPVNKLTKGNPYGATQGAIGVFHTSFAGQFYGPQPPPGSPQPPLAYCPYYQRQQIGHFLYVLDRERKQILVLNSNRFTVLETSRLSDPFEMAVSPNLKRLAVTNFAAGTVSFIDIDPGSSTFHQLVGTTRVGRGPSALAWQPEGEDLLVVNSVGNTLSILNGADLAVRATLGGLLNDPVDVVATLRQNGVGFNTGIYFAYVLNRNGTVAIYESGPNGVNGIGFNDIVGIPEQATFPRARKMENDVSSFSSAVWIAHKDANGLGQVSHLELTSSSVGQIPISPSQGGFILPPTFRQREWTVNGRIGGSTPTTPRKDRLSGNTPVDIAFDEMNNFGTWPDAQSLAVSNLVYADHSGKTQVKINPATGVPTPAITSRFIFVALADTGRIDVVELDTGQVVRTILAPGVRVLAHYWRQ